MIVMLIIYAVFIFFITAGLAKILIHLFKFKKGYQYVLSMFCINFTFNAIIYWWGISGYTELFSLQTQQVTDGQITVGGYLIVALKSAVIASIFATVFYFLWGTSKRRNEQNV
jgi:hypothetical protein